MKTILLITVFALSFCAFAKDSEYLIKEMEQLRDSLELDDPNRIDLTLRLADLYFDVSIKEGEKANEEQRKKHRMKAFTLYENSLYGRKGLKKAEGVNRIKILFQMGRLLSRLDEKEKAESYYLQVFNAPKVPKKIKEQSALALAEWYEEDAKYIKANSFYLKSIKLCDAVETCNYAHYRRAWLLYKDTKLNEAIAELKLSLWDEDKNIRENSLQDLLMFMSNAETTGDKEFKYIKDLAFKINRPELPRKLMEAFYVAGNRRAGSNLLATLNEKDNNLFYDVRLLEEFYGFRNWDKAQFYLDRVSKKTRADFPTKKEEQKEILNILRRFIVQVDAETQVVEDLNSFLKQSIDIYLTFYPNDKMRKKMQQGWLKAEKDKEKKVIRLAKWIQEDLKFGIDKKEIRKLRQTRLALAQELKKSDIVVVEALALEEILKGTKEQREFTYVAARELYTQKKFAEALPLFKKLSDSVVETKSADKWAILSQNLVLDIYNQNKQFDLILSQVSIWRNIPELAGDKKLVKEMASMNKIYTQAEFENTAGLGESKAALEKFYNFCFKGVYAEKSCKNAKVLAVKLKDQAKLVALLEYAKDEKALMNEYEIMGRFADAAKLQEKFNLTRKSSMEDYFRIALLFELGQDFKNRDRILAKLIRKVKKEKKLDKKYEVALYTTLDEANLINVRTLSLPWSLSRKISIANRLETQKSNKTTRKLLLAKKETTGAHWAKDVLAKLQKQFSRIGKIGFYGRSSKWKFKKRTNALEKFATKANSYLEGSDSETRVYILQMLKASYELLAMELRSTPIPEGLDDETLNQVMMQLDTLAKPFETVAADYTRLQSDEMKNLGEELTRVTENLGKVDGKYSEFIKLPTYEVNHVASFDYEKVKSPLAFMNSNPDDLGSLKLMEDFYTQNNSKRLAAYFGQRIKGLAPTKKEI